MGNVDRETYLFRRKRSHFHFHQRRYHNEINHKTKLKSYMATTKLKTGEVITLPLEEMLEFIEENEHLIEKQISSNPRPKRRPLQKTA